MVRELKSRIPAQERLKTGLQGNQITIDHPVSGG
jgi:hypothetical protein